LPFFLAPHRPWAASEIWPILVGAKINRAAEGITTSACCDVEMQHDDQSGLTRTSSVGGLAFKRF